MSKKILYIGGFELPDKNAAAQRVVANAKIFTSLGYSVKLIGLSNFDYDKPFFYEGIDSVNIRYPKGSNWFRYLLSLKAYRKYIEEFQPNIIIAYNHPAVALQRLQKYGKKHGIKIVSDCTEWYIGKGNFIHKLIKNLDTNYRMKIVHSQLDGIIVISQFLKSYYEEKKVKNILLLPPLIDKDNPKWKIAYNNKKEHNGIKLFYAGTGSRKDRLDLIFHCIEEARKKTGKNIEINVYGPDKETLSNNYPEIKETPPFVMLHGRVAHQDVLNELVNHDFQIFFRDNTISNKAGFPTKFVESVTSGVLVLTNDTSDIKNYIDKLGNGYLLDIHSDDNLIDEMLSIFSMSKEQLAIKRNHIDKDYFDYHAYINDTESFLSNLYKES